MLSSFLAGLDPGSEGAMTEKEEKVYIVTSFTIHTLSSVSPFTMLAHDY